MIRFNNDYNQGALDSILSALTATNIDSFAGYGEDIWCQRAETVIKQLVEQNCGITFLYRRAVERELEEGQLRQVFLRGWEVQHEFTFLWRKGSVFEQNYRRLYAQLCQNQEE